MIEAVEIEEIQAIGVICRETLLTLWDYSNWITHSTSSSIQDASIALNLCTTVVSAFENLLDKINDPLAGLKCKKCGSKNLFIAENDENSALMIVCEKCNYGYLKKE